MEVRKTVLTVLQDVADRESRGGGRIRLERAGSRKPWPICGELVDAREM